MGWLFRYCQQKSPASAPPALWWVYLLAMNVFTKLVAKTFRKLQGLTTLVSQQRAELDLLVSALADTVGARGPLTPAAIAAIDERNEVADTSYAVTFQKVEEFLLGLASWVEVCVADAQGAGWRDLVVDIGRVFVVACSRVAAITPERDSNNDAVMNPTPMLPAVLPHELVKMTAVEFLRKARHHSTRLDHTFPVGHIDVIGDEHKELLQAYRNEPVLRSAIDTCSGTTSFEKGWGLLGNRLPALMEFCGGIATVFPGTSTVESDFSVLRWEKNSFRKSLSDFGLEGVLQSKQYERLEAVYLS